MRLEVAEGLCDRGSPSEEIREGFLGDLLNEKL